MPDAYKAEEVEPILADLTSTLDETLQIAKTASDKNKTLEAEVERLKKATPQKEVVIEKVAFKFDQAAVERTVKALVARDLLKEADAKTIEAELLNNPASALRMMEKLAAVHQFPADQAGRGIPKAASSKAASQVHAGADQDGWGKVLTEGA